MYAIIKTGGKQYRVAPQPNAATATVGVSYILDVEKLDAEAGSDWKFEHVLAVFNQVNLVGTVDRPLENTYVEAKILEHVRGPKLIAFKKRRRKNSRRKKGHRQDLTRVQITAIVAAGTKY